MGSASTLVAAIIHKHRLQMTFMDFVKLAAALQVKMTYFFETI